MSKEIVKMQRNNKPAPTRNRSQGRVRTLSERECPACGMGQDEWNSRQGYKQGGEIYCCEGCATETGCTCGIE